MSTADTRTPDSTLPIKRALVSVYDKTGLEELGAALQAAGVEVVSTGSTAARLREAGVEVTPVDALTGFPECLDGRVKTLHPKVHAGILADRRLPDHVQQLEDLGVAPFDLVVVNLYPFTRDGGERGGAGRVRRADRHRRADDGARGRQEPPERGGRRRPGVVRRRRPDAHRRVHVRAAPSAREPRVPAHRGVRRRRRVLVRQQLRRGGQPGRLPRLRRRHLAARQRPALRREPAPVGGAVPDRRPGPGRRRAAARQGDVLQQLRRRRRRLAGRPRPRRRPDRRDHQARQPLRHRRRRRRRRGPPAGARVRPGQRLRRRDRHQRAGVAGDGRAGRRGLHRGRAGTRLRGRRRRAAGEEAVDPAARRPRVGAVAGGDAAGERRPADAGHRPAAGCPATTPPRGRWPPASPPTPTCSPTCSSPGAPAAR